MKTYHTINSFFLNILNLLQTTTPIPLDDFASMKFFWHSRCIEKDKLIWNVESKNINNL